MLGAIVFIYFSLTDKNVHSEEEEEEKSIVQILRLKIYVYEYVYNLNSNAMLFSSLHSFNGNSK